VTKLVLLPDRSEIKKILRANCVKLEYDCADCADDLFKSAIDLDIDALAEEWGNCKPVFDRNINQYVIIKFSDFIKDKVGK
jgi:hypothetical protein